MTSFSLKLDGVSCEKSPDAKFKDFCLEIADDGLHVFVGDNQSGKTTFLKMILGLIKIQRGRIIWTIEGQLFELSAKRPLSREFYTKIGYVPQSRSVWHHKTIFQNVAAPMLAQNKSIEETKKAVELALQEVQLPKDSWEKHTGSPSVTGHEEALSGGEAQRILIARAIVHKPHVIICDEMETSLDEAAMGQLSDYISRGFLSDKIIHRTAIIVTHRPSLWQFTARSLYRFTKDRNGIITAEHLLDRVTKDHDDIITSERLLSSDISLQDENPKLITSAALNLLLNVMQLRPPAPSSELDYQTFMYRLCKDIYLFIFKSAPTTECIVTVTAPQIINGIIKLTRPHLYGAIGPRNYNPDGSMRHFLTPFLVNSKFPDILSKELHVAEAPSLTNGLILQLLLDKTDDVFRGRKISKIDTSYSQIDETYSKIDWFKIDVKGSPPESYIQFSTKTTSVYLFRASDDETDLRIIVGIDMFDNRELPETINSHIAIALATARKALKTAYQHTTDAPE